MNRPKLLDAYACEGGASIGYHRAGFDVYVIDLFKHENEKGERVGYSRDRNPFPAYQGDVIAALTLLVAGQRLPFTHLDGTVEWLGLDDFDAIHTSPPCHWYSIGLAGNPARDGHPRLIAVTRDLLEQTGKPWVIENVERAAHLGEIRNPVLLCGRMFGLEADDVDGVHLLLDRHRVFETNFPLVAPPHPQHGDEQVAGVYGGGRRAKRRPGETLAEVAPRDRYAAKHERQGGYVPREKTVLQQLLGIDWMTVGGMQECIPPIYAEWVGLQLRTHLLSLAVAA